MTVGPKLLLSAFVLKPTSSFVEWLAYHRTIGVTDTLIFIDRRQVGKEPLLSALATAGIVTLVPVAVDPDIKEEIHNSAIRAARLEGANNGGYGLYLAPDEYFCINDPAQSLQSLMQSCGDADVLSAPVQIAGIDPQQTHTIGPILQNAPSLSGTVKHSTFRSAVRLGLFASRTPQGPVGPSQGAAKATWVDGDGVATPPPHSLATAEVLEFISGNDKASILKIPAPSVERFLVHQQALPVKQHPGVEIQIEQLEALAKKTENRSNLGMRGDATATQIALLMALPGVSEAQAALCAQETATCENLRENSLDFQRIVAVCRGKVWPRISETPDPSIADVDTRPEGGAKLPPWFACPTEP